MKKLFLASLIFATSAFVAEAQTNFREISFEQGLEAAKKENKLVFIDFYTTWCGPCKQMSKNTFPQKHVGDFMNERFVSLKLDAEKEGAELAKKYGVKAYPTYVMLDPTGKMVATFSGSMDGDKFIDKVSASLDPDRTPERIKARYEGGERTPQLVNAYAMQFMEQQKEKEGFEVIDNYFNSLSEADRLKPENAFLFTIYTVDLDNDRARFMTENLSKFPESVRPQINRQLSRLYGSVLNTYFSGYMFREGKFNAKEFDDLKAKIAKLGLENEDSKTVYAFIEKRPQVNDEEYLDYIISNYNNLSNQRKEMIILNLARLVAPETPEIKGKMSKFLRGNLSTLSPIGVQFAGRTLQSVEDK